MNPRSETSRSRETSQSRRRSVTRKLRHWLGGAILLALAPGCAYFNTFYFAKKYFNEAERVRLKSESEKLPPEAEKKYDDAITQCGKVIQFHEGSRWVDDAIYLMGSSYYGKRDYDAALKRFDQLLVHYPKSNLVPSSHYMSGLCHFERKEFEAMEASFQKTLEIDPDFDKRDGILFTLAQSAESKRDRPEAVRRYRELVRAYPGSKRGEEALLAIGKLYYDAGRADPAYYDSAYTSYSSLARSTSDDESYREAQIRACETLIELNRAQEAVRILERLLPKDEIQSRQVEDWPARVRIVLARALNDQDRHLEALEVLRQATELYAASSFAIEAQFQIGFTYESYMDSLAAAELAYDRASKMSARSVFREQASTRLQDLRRLQALSTAVGGGTSDEEKKAEALLQIGELYYLSQRQIDQALGQYREVLRQYPQTRIAPRAAYAVAYIHLKAVEGKRDSAVSELSDLIQTYPSSRQARAALDLLIAEEADTSGLRQLLQEPEPEPEPEPVADSMAVSFTPESFVGPPEEGLPISPMDGGEASMDSLLPPFGAFGDSERAPFFDPRRERGRRIRPDGDSQLPPVPGSPPAPGSEENPEGVSPIEQAADSLNPRPRREP